MATSVRAVKRSRVSYDDVDPIGSDALVSASLGMFAASEHEGLYPRDYSSALGNCSLNPALSLIFG